MTYRIKEINRSGFKLYVGGLYNEQGNLVRYENGNGMFSRATVEAWSLAGCLTSLRRLANKLSKTA